MKKKNLFENTLTPQIEKRRKYFLFLIMNINKIFYSSPAIEEEEENLVEKSPPPQVPEIPDSDFSE